MTAVLLTTASFLYSPSELLFPNSDFERGNLTNWVAEGPAFLVQPTYGDNSYFRGMGSCRAAGNYWIGTFENRPHPYRPPGQGQGDPPTGRLFSQEFRLRKDRISFLLGGGDATEQAGVGLEIGGKQVLFAPAIARVVRSERMSRVVWDVSRWKGQDARIVIVDELTGPWGHVNADDFRWER